MMEGETHTGSLGQPAEAPFADLGWAVHARRVCLLDERGAHDVHDKSLGGFDVTGSILERIRRVRDADRNDRWVVRDL